MGVTLPTMETFCPICKLLKNMWRKSFTLFQVLDLGIGCKNIKKWHGCSIVGLSTKVKNFLNG